VAITPAGRKAPPAQPSGERHNDISEQMPNIARGMTPTEIQQAATHYASQP
jgi:hypothetical protein